MKFLYVLLLFASFQCVGQNYNWVFHGYGPQSDYLNNCVADRSGNVYITASFNGLATNSGNVSSGHYIIKVDPYGSILWKLKLLNSQTPKLSFDANDDLHMVGSFVQTVTIGNYSVTSTDSGYDIRGELRPVSDYYICKIAPNGSVLRLNKYGFSGLTDEITGFACNSQGECFVSGGLFSPTKRFKTIIDASGIIINQQIVKDYYEYVLFDRSTNNLCAIYADSVDKFYLARFDLQYNMVWKRRLDRPYNITDFKQSFNGDLLVCGSGIDSVSTASFSIYGSNGQSFSYIFSYTSAGSFNYLRKIGDRIGVNCFDVSSTSNDIYITGTHSNNSVFYRGNSTDTLRAYDRDFFIGKLNPNGTGAWISSSGNLSWDNGGIALAVTTNDHVVYGGWFTDQVEFGTSSISSTSIYDRDFFLVSADANALVLSVKSFERSGFSVFPNPAKGHITVGNVKYAPIEVEIYTKEGKLLRSVDVSIDRSINVNDLSSGTYILKMRSSDKMEVHRVVIIRD